MNTKSPYKLADVELKFINNSLKDLFGLDTVTGLQMFRVSWVNDQFENRLSQFTPAGVELLKPEVMHLPKYNNYPQNTYMLERLVMVPYINQSELADVKLSYEPLWNFEVGQRVQTEACKFVIDTVLTAQAVHKMMLDPETRQDRPLARYKDYPNGNNKEEYLEKQKKKLDILENELFGDESGLLGATLNESGPTIIVPQSFERNKE